MLRRTLALALMLATPAVAAAQSTAPASRPPATRAISVNPLYLPLGGFVVEYENAVAATTTLGLSGGYYDFVGGGDDSYASAEAKVRFYPGERAPRGFSVGVTVGVAHTSDDDCCSQFNDDDTATGATAGVVLDYNWLLGRSRRFFVGTGVGAKRLFGDVGGGDNDIVDIEVLPTLRIQLGAAF